MRSVIVGIAAKNEERSIYSCLASMFEACQQLETLPTFVICLNNCTDSTEEVIRFSLTNDVQIKLLYSNGNLIDAQRKIYKLARAKIIILVDADSIVEKDSIKNLLAELKDEVILTYAVSEINNKPSNFVEKIYKLYVDQNFLTERKYFHGRLFATKVWTFPTKNEIRQKKQLAPYLFKYGNGLIADDIFLSAYIIKNFGENTIKTVPSARVFAAPISSWKDWWATYRRVNIEVRKILNWYPEFKEISDCLYRKTLWPAWFKGSLQEKLLWLVYLTAKKLADIMIATELFKNRVLNPTPKEQWKRTNTTKLPILYRPNLVLFDIDKTLVDESSHYFLNKEIQRKIKLLISRGWTIGVATHRSYKGSSVIYKQLKLNGPLLVEGGARVFVLNKKQLIEVPLFEDKARVLPIIRKSIKEYFKLKNIDSSVSANQSVTDVNKVSIFISRGRNKSSSLYIYKHGKPNRKQAEDLRLYLQNSLLAYGMDCEHANTKGKLHIFYKDINKSSSLKRLRQLYYPDCEITLIGDAEEDIPVSGFRYCGVRKSVPEYKSICEFVAAKDGKAGIVEILDYLGASYGWA